MPPRRDPGRLCFRALAGFLTRGEGGSGVPLIRHDFVMPPSPEGEGFGAIPRLGGRAAGGGGPCGAHRDGVERVLSYLDAHPEAKVVDEAFDRWCDRVIEAQEEAKKSFL